jgi:hypothetical protein
MPVELNLVESVTELDTTVVTVILESASEPGPAGPGGPAGGTDGQVLTKTSATDYATAWEDATGGGGGVTDADYLVGTAHAGLSAEIVVGTSPGGELGGTWASPTVDASHSGSTHAAVQAAAEATAAAALSAHDGDTTNVHGIADTSALALSSGVPSNATFNDHSARHENGGADEISIAGLDGTSTELAAHLADATAAHAATAIAVTPDGSISATTVQAAIVEVRDEAGGGGAPTDATYITQTANGTLSNEQALSALSTGVVKVTTTTGVLSTAVANTDYAAATHASRHEDGGADEISLTGLSGTPAALTTHEADTTSVHGITDTSTLYRAGGTDVAMADGGTGASLADPGADRIMFWDDSAGVVTWLQAGTNLTITDTTIAASGGGGGAQVVPIELTTPRLTSLQDNCFWTVLGLTDWDAGHWEFLKDVEGKLYGQVAVPDNYTSGGVIRLLVAANATSGVTRLQVGTKAVADGESLNPTLTDETAQDITVPGTAYLRKDVTFTLTETLADKDLLLVEVFHDGDHANDTLNANTLLFGAWLEYTA